MDVATKALTQAVRRNMERFPRDFMFQLTPQEVTNLRSQTVTSSSGSRRSWGGRRSLPYPFSETRRRHELVELERRVGYHDEAISGIVRSEKS
jgi:hypothetical protein